MAIAATAGVHTLSQPAAQLLSHHKRGGPSLADGGASSPSAPSAPRKAGTIGSKLDISA